MRLDPRVKARLVELVEDGEYRSLSGFITEAILQKLALEGIAVEGTERPRNPVQLYPGTPEGRERLLRLIHEERAWHFRTATASLIWSIDLPHTMDRVTWAIERGERAPEEVACLRVFIRSALRGPGLPARERADPDSREPVG